MKKYQSLKFLDLFSGIGGFRLGMERAHNQCVGWCDINKYARRSYQNMYKTRGEWIGKDIRTVKNSTWRKINKKYGQINVICGGFPCQSFSIAGNRKGFLDKTRGTLFFQIARAAKEIKPQYLFLENVKGLLNHRHGETFKTILSTLDELGYNAEWHVFNSKYFGVPQNRERVYIIGHLRTACTSPVFCKPEGSKSHIKSLSKGIIKFHNSKNQRRRLYSSKGISPTVSATDYKDPTKISYFYNARKHGKYGGTYNILNKNGVCTTLSTMQGGNREPKVNLHDLCVRKLTPKECWRLQGYPDWLFDRAKEVNSNSQLYKQAGNSVSIPVIEYIAKRLKVY